MQVEIVTVVEFACRKGLVRASQEQGELDLIELCLLADIKQIHKHGRAGVAEWIELGSVDQRPISFCGFLL